MVLPGPAGGPVTETVGYFNLSATVLAEWLAEGLGPHWKHVASAASSSEEVLSSLKPSVRVSRYACIPVAGAWTVVLNNGPNGTDVGVLPSLAVRKLGCTAARATLVDRDGAFAARILEVFGSNGAPPLRTERSIAAANDGGGWVFETFGSPFDFENVEAYNARRKADRFTGEMLYSYMRSLEIPIDSEIAWADAIHVVLAGG